MMAAAGAAAIFLAFCFLLLVRLVCGLRGLRPLLSVVRLRVVA